MNALYHLFCAIGPFIHFIFTDLKGSGSLWPSRNTGSSGPVSQSLTQCARLDINVSNALFLKVFKSGHAIMKWQWEYWQ